MNNPYLLQISKTMSECLADFPIGHFVDSYLQDGFVHIVEDGKVKWWGREEVLSDAG